MRPTKPRTTEFGIVLSGIRNEAGMTVTQLARRADVSVSYVSQLETGKKPPNDRIIRRICGPLGVDPRVLYRAADILTMSLADTLRPVNVTVRLEEDLSEFEIEELIKYLSFLRYKATLEPTSSGTRY